MFLNNTHTIFIFIYIIISMYLHLIYHCTIPLIQENIGQLFRFVPLAQQTAHNAPQTARNGRHRSSSLRVAGTFLSFFTSGTGYVCVCVCVCV
jgi:hypothetical protein